MDPKSPNNLDPKLKEIYDRVMGTNTTPIGPEPSHSATPQSSPSQLPTTNLQSPSMTTPAAPTTPTSSVAPTMASTTIIKPTGISTPPTPTPTSASDHLTTPPLVDKPRLVSHEVTASTPTHVPATPPPTHDETVTQVKKGSPFMKVFFIIAGVLFLGIYAIFWMKYFNIPIPFLPAY